MGIAVTAEQVALQRSVQDWAASSDLRTPVRVAHAEPSATHAEPGATHAEPGATHAEPGAAHLARSDSAADDIQATDSSTQPGWTPLYQQAANLGLMAAAISPHRGGVSGDLLDAAVAQEAAGRALIPGPLLGTALAAVLLDRFATGDLVQSLLPALADGTLTGSVAVGCQPLTATRTSAAPASVPADGLTSTPDAPLALDGELTPLLGAESGAASVLIVPAQLDGTVRWLALQAPATGLELVDLASLDLTQGLCRAEVRGLEVSSASILPGLTTQQVLDLAATLAAAQASGLADATLRTAVDYARVRVQFGRPIGSFQAIKHLCAAMLCRAQEATAVAWDAARAYQPATTPSPVTPAAAEPAGPAATSAVATAPTPAATSATPADQAHLAAAVAATIALKAALENARDSIQVLGGIGFTWEHDAHLYLRRAQALRQWLGGTGLWRARAAELVKQGVRRDLHLPASDTNEASAEPPAALSELRERVATMAAALPQGQDNARARRAALAHAQLLVPHWPPPYGLGASAREQLVIDEELTSAGIERPDLGVAAWAVPTIVLHGTDKQRERFVEPSLRGDLTWCQLFSEPEAGSDLASLRTKAERVEGGWALTGQKVWTSLAHTADWAICLARTDPNAPQHRGITYFLVDMRSPGIQALPLREMTGEALFNEVFLNQVFVPDDLVVGEVNGGWKLARSTLAAERVSMGGYSALGYRLEGLLSMPGRDSLGDDRLGDLIGHGCAVSLIGLLATARRLEAEAGGPAAAQSPEATVLKLLGVRHRQDVAQAAFDVLGPAGLAVTAETAAAQHELLLTRCLSIAGGTTQILLNLIGEQVLGLPREPAVVK